MKEINNLNKCDYVLDLFKINFLQEQFDELKLAVKHSIMYLKYLRPHISILTSASDTIPWKEILLFTVESKMVLMREENVQLGDLDFDEKAVLGHGTYGTVFKGSSLNDEGNSLRSVSYTHLTLPTKA